MLQSRLLAEQEKLRSCERGLRSGFSRGARPARPARPPRLFTLAGRCVSLLCWLEGWGGARGPERSLGEEDAVLGGRWGVRSPENVNFIPSCQCGTSVQQGRGQTQPPPVRLLCAGRPARPPRLRASSSLRLPALGSQRSGCHQQFCFLKDNLWRCCDRRSYPGVYAAPPIPAGVVSRYPPPPQSAYCCPFLPPPPLPFRTADLLLAPPPHPPSGPLAFSV